MLRNKLHNIVFVFASIGLITGWIIFGISIWYFFVFLIISFLIKVYASFTIRSQYYVHAICSGNTQGNAIALTFDDGPVTGKTNRILDILKEKDAPATFFCIGNRVAKNPDLIKRMDAEGHLVGNHSYDHKKSFPVQSLTNIVTELTKTDQSIEAVIRKKPAYFRPPFGVTNPVVAGGVLYTRHTVIGWTVRSLDTVTKDRKKLWNRITRNLAAGDIVLFHDYVDLTIELLPEYIDHIRKSGLKIVRLDQLIGKKPYA